MPNHKITIQEMTFSQGPTHVLFSLKANGIPLQVSCTLKEFKTDHEKTMEKVNSCFIQSLRHLKLYGDIPSKPDPKQLNVWTKTDSGIAIRGNKIPIKEYTPFKF